jgi:hypothetical protein
MPRTPLAAFSVILVLVSVMAPVGAFELESLTGRDSKRWRQGPATAALWERHLLQGWRDQGPKDPRWDADMPIILAAAAERAVWQGDLPPAHHGQALKRLMDHLKDRRLAADPTARFAAMVLEPEGRRRFPHVDALLASPSASKAALPAGHLMGAMAEALCYASWNGSDKADAHQPAISRNLARLTAMSMARGEFDAAPHAYIVHLDYLELYHSGHLAELRTAIATRAATAAAMTDPWLAPLIDGILAEAESWARRGTGFADTVSEEAWRGFAERQQIAADRYRQAWAVRNDDPAPAIMLFRLANSQARVEGTALDWLTRALVAGFDHPGIYAAMRTYASPRWGGSHGELAVIAKACVGGGRFDTIVPWQLVVGIRHIDQDKHPVGRDSPALRDPAMRKALDACIDGYLAGVRATDAATRGHFESHRICALVRLGHLDEARRRLRALPADQRRPEVARAWDISFKDLGADAPAAADPNSQDPRPPAGF